jgi:hypothetical protein
MNALENYLEELYAIRSSGGAVKETSSRSIEPVERSGQEFDGLLVLGETDKANCSGHGNSKAGLRKAAALRVRFNFRYAQLSYGEPNLRTIWLSSSDLLLQVARLWQTLGIPSPRHIVDFGQIIEISSQR